MSQEATVQNATTVSSNVKSPRPGMGDVLRAFRRPKVAVMLALGFSSGLPFLLTAAGITRALGALIRIVLVADVEPGRDGIRVRIGTGATLRAVDREEDEQSGQSPNNKAHGVLCAIVSGRDPDGRETKIAVRAEALPVMASDARRRLAAP